MSKIVRVSQVIIKHYESELEIEKRKDFKFSSENSNFNFKKLNLEYYSKYSDQTLSQEEDILSLSIALSLYHSRFTTLQFMMFLYKKTQFFIVPVCCEHKHRIETHLSSSSVQVPLVESIINVGKIFSQPTFIIKILVQSKANFHEANCINVQCIKFFKLWNIAQNFYLSLQKLNLQ